MASSPVLAQSLPQALVELSLAFLQKELPDEQVARQKQKLRDQAEWRKAVLAKPEAERTRLEKMTLSSASYLRAVDFSNHDWQRLSIHDDHRSFWPPSPLREPFHSLFQSSPEEALRLLRELCNHAMTAWRQLHCYSRERGGGTPIPLELKFPWGAQRFWGTDREYLWFRSTWAPNAIGCGFMALEEWCFAEFGRSRPVDELIQQIVEGNECIAIVGIASMLALHTERVSEATLPLFTSQRLLAADHNRMVQDLSSTANLIGFTDRADKPHFDAVQAANMRPVRKTQLSWMVPRFVFAPKPICDRAREAILNFKNDLPYQYEEHRKIPEALEHLTAQAVEYAALADPKNYQAYRTEEDSDQIAVVHVSPSAADPEKVARADEASKRLRQNSLWMWASKSFEEKGLSDTFAIEDAIALAKEADASDLFQHSKGENEQELLGVRRGAVAATAAIVLSFRKGRTQEDLEWARDVLGRAIRLPEKPNLMWSPSSVIPWHQAIYVARGLAADLLEGAAAGNAAHDLLGLVAHPLEAVSLAALEETGKLWSKDPRITWAALILAFSLCHVPPQPRGQARQHGELLHSTREAQAAVAAAFAFYQKGSGWSSLPQPPPAWVKVDPGKGGHQNYEDYDADDAIDANEAWSEPDVFWHSKQAAEILQRVPFDEVLPSSANSAVLDFLGGVLDWTIQKNSPPWVKPGRRDRSAQIYEWTYALGSRLGHVAGLIPLADFQARFLDPILSLEGDNCWALLSPFVSTYVCTYVYDAPIIPSDAVEMLDLCLERLLQP